MHDDRTIPYLLALSLAFATGCGDSDGDSSSTSSSGPGGSTGATQCDDGSGGATSTGETSGPGGAGEAASTSTASATASSGSGGSTPCDPSDTCSEPGDFQVGGTVVFAGDPAVEVAMQTVADVAGIAAASVDELTGSCRTIAEVLDAPRAQRSAIAGLATKLDRMNAWCSLAVSAVTTIRGSASLLIDLRPPQCSTSVGVRAECQGRCADVACDPLANPSQCADGRLSIACRGECNGSGGSSVDCVGSCSGTCQGACSSEGGVDCEGECDGTCEATVTPGSGIQADGICSGSCEGTCEVTAPSSGCDGSCDGSCSASCQGSAEASAWCDGECSGESEPFECRGGELQGGCAVDATCGAHCDAAAYAMAFCTPADVDVRVTGAIDANASGKLVFALERTLGKIAEIQARASLLAPAMASLTSIDAAYLAGVKGACIPVVLAASAGADANVEALLVASTSVLGGVGN